MLAKWFVQHQRKEVFRDDAHRQQFLSTRGEACGKTRWQVHAHCLVGNRFHPGVATPEPNLAYGLKGAVGRTSL